MAHLTADGAPRRARVRALGAIALGALLAFVALWVARNAGVNFGIGLDTGAWRAVGAAAALMAICGFGPTRMLLPAGLRRHELLWILPVGACTLSLAVTVLGFAAVPFDVALVVVLGAHAALGLIAVLRRGPPPRPGLDLAWPGYLALLLVAVALIPVFRAGFLTVTGEGSDAHLVVGSAEFLQHNYPTSVNTDEPVDRVPRVWASKQPIFYALASVARVSGLEPFEVLAPMAAVLLALSGVGFFLLARELLGAGAGVAAAVMGVVSLDRIVMHTALHPYFAQFWGYFTLPFALTLSWWAVRHRSRGGVALLGLFLMVGALAYPLALPIPLAALGVFVVIERRRRAAESPAPAEPWLRSSLRRPRTLLLLLPVALLLVVPVLGVLDKVISAAKVVLPGGGGLLPWAGDLLAFIPGERFFGLPFSQATQPIVVALLVLALLGLRGRPRALALGLGAVIGGGLLLALYFSQRNFGWYFHFKVLAYTAPLILACAVVGATRLLRIGPVLVAALALGAIASARQELDVTFPQLTEHTIELREWAAGLPEEASVRLDMWPPRQLWAGYMLARQPICSQLPLMGTSYPRVELSRRADYLLVWHLLGRPADASGEPLRENAEWKLYRARRDIPGADRCSRRMVQEKTYLPLSGTR